MERLWDSVKYVYLHDKLNWDIALGAMLLLLGLAYAQRRLSWETMKTWEIFNYAPKRRGRRMWKARRDFVRKDTIDALVEHIELRVAQGDYTRKEASELYRDARKYWPVKDLFPSPELLKENIKRRLAATSKNQPVPLPDRVEKPRRKHAFDKTAKA